MQGKKPSEREATGTSRRQFLKQCGIAVVAAAAYEVMSVMMPGVAEATTSSVPLCNTSCVSSSNQSVPPVNPPKCVCTSGCINSCISGCQVNCTGCIVSSTTAKS